MLRARRAVASASCSSASASGASRSVVSLRAARRLPAHNALLAAHASSSRFSLGGARNLTVLARQRPLLQSHALGSSLLQTQSRWRSALTDAQQDALSKRMDELAACRDSGNWRQALKLLDKTDKEGFALDAEMYELAMAACARMGKIEVLPGLLQNMEVDAIVPTHRTIDFVMQAYIAAEEWKLIVKLAKEMTGKGVALSDAAFQAAFEACGKIRDAHGARQIMLQFEQIEGVEVDESHYAAAIRACGMGGRPDLSASLFTHMEEKRGVQADAEAFNMLIRAQIVNGALPQALQTFATAHDRFDESGLLLPESIYTASIDALVNNGEFWQASQLFSQMMSHDVSPSVFCYGRMMFAYVRLNKHELARECWQRVLEIDEPNPSLMKYTKMVTQLSTTNDSELAVDVFEHIFPKFDPSAIRDTTYAAAIRAYGRLGHTQTSLDLFDTFVASRRRIGKPLPRSAGIYLAVFNALSRDTERDPKQNTKDAQKVWDIMVQSVPVVLAPAYASLAGVLASSGDLATLEELMEHAEESLRSQPDRRTTNTGGRYGAKRQSSQQRGGGAMRADESFNPFSDMEETAEFEDDEGLDGGVGQDGDRQSAASWRDELLFNGVISGFSKARSDQSERVLEYLKTMWSRGMTINDSVVRAATDTFVKHEQWAHMYELFEFVDVRALQNADVCFGDTISKMLEAGAWEPARFWISRAHRMDVQPPIRGKMEVLRRLKESNSHEWQIAYALARETLSFKQMVQENVDSVSDAIDVCANAGRMDLVIKLFERTSMHPSVVKGYQEMQIPLHMYKATLLACMREHTTTPNFEDGTTTPIEKAEAICAQMLQEKGKHALEGDALSLAISIKATMGDDDDVIALFGKMQQHALQPNSYAYNAAIMAHSRAKQLDKVLQIRDQLVAQAPQIVQEPKITQSLLFSLAILQDDAALAKHMAETRALLPHVTTDQVMNAFLQANRAGKCVEFFDETVSEDVFNAVLWRIMDGPRIRPNQHQQAQERADIALCAPLLLKFIAYHGLDNVKPPGVVLRVTKQLLQHGKLPEAKAILKLFSERDSEVALSDMKPSFQKDVLEMLLYIHGEEKQFGELCELFDKTAKPSAVPLNVRHYQLAMEYCLNAKSSVTQEIEALEKASAKKLTKKQREAQLVEGATAGLKLFESLRTQFVKPNGPVYLLALQSCYRLDKLELTGARVVGDAKDQGFSFLLSSELFRLANLAVFERREKENKSDAKALEDSDFESSDEESTTPKRRGRGKAKTFQVDVQELYSMALFCHHQGVPISWKLASKLLELKSALPKPVRSELEYIVSSAEAAYSARAAENLEKPEMSRAARAALPARKPTPPPKRSGATSPKTTTAKAGARWGELYLQKLPSDEV